MANALMRPLRGGAPTASRGAHIPSIQQQRLWVGWWVDASTDIPAVNVELSNTTCSRSRRPPICNRRRWTYAVIQSACGFVRVGLSIIYYCWNFDRPLPMTQQSTSFDGGLLIYYHADKRQPARVLQDSIGGCGITLPIITSKGGVFFSAPTAITVWYDIEHVVA